MNSWWGRIASLWRTTTVRLTAIFIAIFIIFSVLLLGYTAFQVSYAIQRQQTDAIHRETGQLVQLDRQRGIRSVAIAVQQLSQRPGPGIYYLGDATGQQIVGNVSDFPPNILAAPGEYSFSYDRNVDLENPNAGDEGGYAVVQTTLLDNGFRLVVGRDVVERRGFTAIIFGWLGLGVLGIVVLSALAGGITANRVIKRIDSITATSSKIMSGNLSERVPMTRRNDEFDDLARSLNAMLDRIEQLLQGLKDVTDNVAHDLKTPLTRLRNRAQAALGDKATEETRRETLEGVIEESDQLIRTFNALLLIARVEAGTPSGAFSPVNLKEVVEDIVELYEPVAEEQGARLTWSANEGIVLEANRELLGQALVNLIENAIKYGVRRDHPEGEDDADRPKSTIDVRTSADASFITLEVCDNGPGIPEGERGRVLERFVRLEKSRTAAGSGLGLSLVSAVAHLHKGELVLDDNHPGLCARLVLPRKR
ncbi:MAG: HAMP domain-containing protein [Hyphomicrobiaceae bacterium]|nr:HAMP domain-containing protein [Hyphomicrobiaceae bacterium]MCC0025286.1 HAMP domain-containing protein [Hyphomicrobiaceae bacterium]